MSKLKRLVLLLFILVITIPIIGLGMTSFFLSDLHDTNINTETLDDLSHSHKEGISNILIMGSDARPGEKTSRTDSMMILTIDKINKSIKITSLARDTLVNIPGYGYSKLTHAYAFGKEDLLIKTIEKNFDIDINDFIMFNFESFIAIIDSIGGVTVDISEGEMNEMNKFIPETHKWSKSTEEMKLITNTGSQKINGYQALSYARIRKNDSAFNRDNRQRMLVSSLLKEVKDVPTYKYPFILKAAAPYISTNMKTPEIIRYGLSMLRLGTSDIKQLEFPLVSNPKYTTGGIYKNYGWVLRYDPESVIFLKDFIFKDINIGE